MKKNFLAACALCAVSFPVLAGNFYAAGEIGQAKWKAGSESETDTAFGIAGGYKFNDIFAVELGYRDLGGFSESYEDLSASVDLTALQLSVVANHAVNDTFGVYGRLGFADLKADASYSDSEGSASGSDSKTKAVFGIGASYAASQTVSLFAEYDQYGKYEGLKVSTFSVGAKFQF